MTALWNPKLDSADREANHNLHPRGEKPRVLFIINSLSGGGAERVMTTLLEHSKVRSASHDIRLLILDDDPRAFPLPEWLTVIQSDCRKGTISSIFAVERVVKDFDPDIALSFLTRSNIASGIAMMKRSRPWIISERTSTSAHLGNGARQLVTKSLIRLIYPRATRLIAVSSGVAQKLETTYAVDIDRIAVIPNPVDRRALEKAAAEPSGLRFNEPYIIAVGRLVAVKNYALLIQAFAKSKLNSRLVIAGEGRERKSLERLASDLGIADRVDFPGWLSNPYPALKQANVFALSSNVEGFPNALVEALALGVPSVATNCNDGPSEILARTGAESISGLTVADAGILSPVGDVESYAKALRIAFDEKTKGGLVAAGLKRSESYSAVSIAKRYWDLVESELKARAKHRA